MIKLLFVLCMYFRWFDLTEEFISSKGRHTFSSSAVYFGNNSTLVPLGFFLYFMRYFFNHLVHIFKFCIVVQNVRKFTGCYYSFLIVSKGIC